ncbi:MAG: ABC transporter permease [Oscillospiraceae bacterium]|nr:ABC transporter permease [Oscillospiraceae bacterium]
MDIAGIAKKFIKGKTFSLLCMLMLIIVFFWYFSPNHSFLSVTNIVIILNSMVLFILFAVAVSMLIISGEVDLSPGFIGTAAGATMAALLEGGTVPWFVAVIICLLMGIGFGLINAVLVNKFRIQSFIATLAVGTFLARGFSFIVSGGRAIPVRDPVISWLGTARIGDVVPVTVLISLAIILVYGTILSKTKFGRGVYLCGGNREAARLAGLNPKKLSYLLFANSGMLGALAGILFVARIRSGNLDGTNAFSFPAVTAVIFGGISFGGGSGKMLGCFLGLLIINAFNNGLTIMRVSPFWQDVASGLLLLLALTLDYISTRRANRASIPKSARRLKQEG